MGDDNRNITVAYGDESVRMAGAPPFYMMGVALIPDSAQIDPELFRRIMPKGSRKLHWRDMNEGLQRKSLRLLSEVERADLVVIASPLAGRKQERARRKCLEALLPSYITYSHFLRSGRALYLTNRIWDKGRAERAEGAHLALGIMPRKGGLRLRPATGRE